MDEIQSLTLWAPRKGRLIFTFWPLVHQRSLMISIKRYCKVQTSHRSWILKTRPLKVRFSSRFGNACCVHGSADDTASHDVQKHFGRSRANPQGQIWSVSLNATSRGVANSPLTELLWLPLKKATSLFNCIMWHAKLQSVIFVSRQSDFMNCMFSRTFISEIELNVWHSSLARSYLTPLTLLAK